MQHKKLKHWLQAGLISRDQVAAIEAFEAQQQRPIAMLATVGIGVFTLGLGIQSVIAGNWDRLSDHAKIVGFFCIYIGSAAGVLAWREAKPIAAMVCRGLYFLLTIAGIGLISQIFNMNGPTWGALALWAGLTLPAMISSRFLIWPGAWWALYYVTALAWAMESQSGESEDIVWAKLALLMLAPTLLRTTFLPEKAKLLASSFLAPLVDITLALLWLVLPLQADILSNAYMSEETGSYFRTASVLFAVAILHALKVWWTASPVTRKRDVLILAGSLGLPLFFCGMHFLMPSLWFSGELFGAIEFISCLVLACFACHVLHWRRAFEVITFLIAIRLFIIYQQIIGSLIIMGIGMILSGLVLLGIAYGWNRLRKRWAPAASRPPILGGTP